MKIIFWIKITFSSFPYSCLKTFKTNKAIILPMKRYWIIFILIFVLASILAYLFIFFLFFSGTPQIAQNTVVNVIDGDTLEIYDNGSIQIVRLLCVDTPEKNQTGYEKAKIFLQSEVLGKQVVLQSSITDKDVYGRLLRYVYVNNSENNTLFVNKLILEGGYGTLMIIPPEECKEVMLASNYKSPIIIS